MDPFIKDQKTAEVVEDPTVKKLHTRLRQQVESCKQYRRQLVRDWQTNVDYRRGKPFPSQSDEDRIAVPLDWSLTKQKWAALFSQIPTTRVSHPPQTLAPEAMPWLHSFETKLNDMAIQSGAEAAMEEVGPDCINAAGIGICLVSREVITRDVETTVQDLSVFTPEQQEEIKLSGVMLDGTPLQIEMVPVVLDSRYVITRISPSDFLWPLSFTGSDFDKSPWIGRSGRIPWAVAKRIFKLSDEDKKAVVGDNRSTLDRIDKIAYESDRDNTTDNEELVSFDELFYHDSDYDTEASFFGSIHHVVFVEGKQKAVIDESWKGQSIIDNQIVGSMRYPIQVLTLSYVTDDAIPPSDSAIGRPQVNEINKSRTQMILQRQHSLPVKWIDPNRVDPAILYNLMRGTWQQYVPIVGGANAIGEVSRSNFPQENWGFHNAVKADLAEAWQTGGLTAYGEDVETKAETQAIGTSVSTRIGKERARVAKFYTRLMEVLGGLMSIYEEPESIGKGFSPVFSKALSYSILADSTVLLDSDQRLKKLIEFVNFTAKSGWVNLEPVLREIASLSGLDPATVIQPPAPKEPAEPNMSIRLTGTEDLYQPLPLAFLIKTGQAPPVEMIEQAKVLIEKAVTPPPPKPILMGPDGLPIPPEITPGAEGVLPEPPPPAIGDANPNYSAMSRVNSRVLERESNG